MAAAISASTASTVPVARKQAALVSMLRGLAITGLARMYRRDEGLFAFRLRRRGDDLVLEGTSPRYTAMALIGLAGEAEAVQTSALGGITAREACNSLIREPARLTGLGDLAVALWAACATGAVERRPVIKRLLSLRPGDGEHATVDVAWALAALCAEASAPVGTLRRELAHRLIAAMDTRSGMFPHRLGNSGGGFRSHVSCFADLVYPTHALARYADMFGDAEARDAALVAAREMCARQGEAGQWWWHHDHRTGELVERYPVYAVHQDAMAPMALFAVQNAAGTDFRVPIGRGLSWLARAPELGGGSLIDHDAGVIWRKVARREPAKLSRYVQAAASRLHPTLRTPWLDSLFPPGAIDHEDRPYHLGWLLHAWPADRAARWDGRGAPA